MSIRAKPRERSSSRKVTPPSASYMSDDQFSSYLSGLRNSRVVRPGGARPLPSSCVASRRLADRQAGSVSLPRTSSELPDTSSLLAAARQRSQSDVPVSATSAAAATEPASYSALASVSAPAPAPSPSPAPTSSPYFSRPSLDMSVVGSVSSRYSTISGRGRDYYPDKRASSVRSVPPPLRPDEVVPTDTYMERGQRWMEKEEAVSLRQALEDMDLKALENTGTATSTSTNTNMRPLSTALVPAPSADVTTPDDADEHRIYHAALDEAAELVWQHQNGIKPPESGAPYSYKQHLRKNSYAYARTASVGRYGDDIEPTGLARDPAVRSVSDSSTSSAEGGGFSSIRSRYSLSSSARPSLDQTRPPAAATPTVAATATATTASASTSTSIAAGTSFTSTGTVRSKAYTSLAGGPRPMVKSSAAHSSSNSSSAARRRSSMKRNISGEIEKPFSGDQIYEEPETATPHKDARDSAYGDNGTESSDSSGRGSSSVLRAAKENTVHGSSSSNNNDNNNNTLAAVSKLVSRYEIHRNPPSQSRNPQYTVNSVVVAADLAEAKAAAAAAEDSVPRKNGVEIRSDEIRQATSMKLKDRNPKLPTPSFVSDNPGRPIVSFDANWKQEAPPVAGQDSATDAQLEATGSGSGNGSQSQPQSQPQSRHQPKGSPSPFSSALRNRLTTSTPVSPVAPVASSWSAPPPTQQQQQQQHPQPQQQQQQQQPQPQQQKQQQPWQQQSEQQTRRGQPPTIVVNGGSNNDINTNPIPSISVTASEQPRPATNRSPMPMPIPTISVSEEPSSSSFNTTAARPPPIPTIVLPGDDADDEDAPTVSPSIPVIVTPDDTSSRQQSSRPLPSIVVPDSTKTAPAAPTSSSRRPLPTPGSAGATNRPRGHWSRAPPSTSSASNSSHASASRATALCHECGYAIEGRFVALAGQTGAGSTAGAAGSERFHPGCFRCYACGTSLEALEISPEPNQARSARLDRIARRARGEVLEERPGETMAEDGDARLRFFCHLDWHEMYAPRCRHCKTPIVGEHVVALGHHWHAGHFFCAECGDPFGPGATHIEKDGYAWCVGCQTRRTERRAPRCRACGKPAIGAYVQALGAEWHDDCFRCAVCEGGFADGQIFPRQGTGGLMQVVCTGCRQRELKA